MKTASNSTKHGTAYFNISDPRTQQLLALAKATGKPVGRLVEEALEKAYGKQNTQAGKDHA